MACQVHVSLDHAGVIHQDAGAKASSWHRKAGNGTIAVLVKTESRSLWELRFLLVPSLIRNIHFQTPVTIMFEGDRQLVEDATEKLRGHSLLQPLNFVDVTVLFTPSEDEAAMLAGPDVRMKDYDMGYRKMCEFWAAHVHTLPALTQYRYIWRLDTDSSITEPVFVDLYQVMQVRDSVYGYLLLQKALPEACQGLQKATESFYEAHPEFDAVSTDAETLLHNFEARRCPHWNTNFQLMDLDFFRRSHVYRQYVKHLSENVHGFVKYRWGDHIVQTLAVLLQVPPHGTLCMQPWVPGYVHQNKTPNCDARIYEPALVGEVATPSHAALVQLHPHNFLLHGSSLAVLACVICCAGAAWYMIQLKYRQQRLSDMMKKLSKDQSFDAAAVQEASARLDARLDSMMRYLELRSNDLEPDVRTTVFNHVKNTMEWKARERSPSLIHKRVEALDAAMMDITQHINKCEPVKSDE